MKLDIPHFVQQKSNTCGLAVLRMIFAFYGEHVSEEELEKVVDLHSFGTFTTDLGIIALKRGYRVTSYTFKLSLLASHNFPYGTDITRQKLDKFIVVPRDEWTYESWVRYIDAGGKLIYENPAISLLKNYLNKNTPCIVNLNTAVLHRFYKRWDNGHIVIANGADDKKVSVVDPSRKMTNPRYDIDVETFLSSWIVNAFQSSAFLQIISK